MRSAAESGEPLFLSYCSASPPLEGVYFAAMETKPSEYVFIAEVRVVYVDVDEANVPTAAAEENNLKKGRERDVTLNEP